jgi:hypothetical protein
VQEPVGEVNRYGLDSHGRKWHGIHWYDANVDVPHGTKLYTTPPAQEFVCSTGLCHYRKPLTDEQISAIGSKIFPSTWNTRHVEFARAIEAELKELDT